MIVSARERERERAGLSHRFTYGCMHAWSLFQILVVLPVVTLVNVTATDGDGEVALECLVAESNLSNQVAWEWNGSHRGYN